MIQQSGKELTISAPNLVKYTEYHIRNKQDFWPSITSPLHFGYSGISPAAGLRIICEFSLCCHGKCRLQGNPRNHVDPKRSTLGVFCVCECTKRRPGSLLAAWILTRIKMSDYNNFTWNKMLYFCDIYRLNGLATMGIKGKIFSFIFLRRMSFWDALLVTE